MFSRDIYGTWRSKEVRRGGGGGGAGGGGTKDGGTIFTGVRELTPLEIMV